MSEKHYATKGQLPFGSAKKFEGNDILMKYVDVIVD